MTPPATATVLMTLDEQLARSAPEQQGALWRLAEPGRGLDANVVRLSPGGGVAEHSDDVLDVLLVVLDGDGYLGTPDGRQRLTPHTVVWLPRTSYRSLSAGDSGLVYLTAHPRRPGLSVSGAGSGVRSTEGGGPSRRRGRVCAECGRLAQESDARFCGRCGHRLPERP
ncbi:MULTISPECIES: zinc ribbon domain-containing protein [unclassified Streptomyces]|uniref:zinc ribbon domain-containing protein n=1 Tax=unclassified Streptomyces TaxID=2593676 RepID=UPI002E2C987D|nr:zinc ribbon domain-containing protein [Streptomyces sp. NBC_01429]